MKDIKIEKNNLFDIKNSLLYKSATNLFPDAEITDIKDLESQNDE